MKDKFPASQKCRAPGAWKACISIHAFLFTKQTLAFWETVIGSYKLHTVRCIDHNDLGKKLYHLTHVTRLHSDAARYPVWICHNSSYVSTLSCKLPKYTINSTSSVSSSLNCWTMLWISLGKTACLWKSWDGKRWDFIRHKSTKIPTHAYQCDASERAWCV